MRYTFALLTLLAGFTSQSFGAVVFSDDLSYPDGNLTDTPDWTGHSGSGSLIQVAGGEAVLVHGAGSREDANAVIGSFTSGILTYGFDVTVVDPGGPYVSGGDEYFAHFKDDGFGFSARLDLAVPTGAGDYSFGISSLSSTADVTTVSDFNFGDSVAVLVSYDIDTSTASLTVGGETIVGTVGGSAGEVTQFALRQSNSATDETILIDNIVVSSVSAVPEPGSLALLCVLGVATATRRRRR